MTDITIIMVSYNSAHLIADSIDKAPEGCPVIVVDNASADETCAIVKAHKRKSVKLIRNKENLGFGTANNIALRQCKTRYALLLNPDAEISLEDLQKLQAALDADNKAVLAGPMLLEGGKTVAEKKIKIRKYPMFHKNRPLLTHGLRFWVRQSFTTKDLSRAYECGFIGGAVLLYDLQKMPEVIYFDEDIFMYKDESELAYRIMEKGYKLLLVPYAVASHGKMASSKFANKKQRMQYKYYQVGYSVGVLARKYPHQVNRLSVSLHLLSLMIVQAFCTIIISPYASCYKAKRVGFMDGYKGKKSR